MKWLMITIVLCLAATTAFAYTEQQAAHGKQLFTRHCAVCHGPEGHGGTVPAQFSQHAGLQAPPVAGPGGLPGMTTAGQVYKFITTNMPLNAPGTLSKQDYIDIVAFDLQANKIMEPGDKPLTAADADKIQLVKGGGKMK